MVNRHRWLVVAIGLSFTFAACKGKKEEAKPAAVGSGSAGGAPAAAAPGASPATSAPKSDLSYLPLDSEVVFGVNAAQLQASPLWKKFVAPQLSQEAEFVSVMAEINKRCGFDPMQVVQRLSGGLKNLTGDVPDGVLVVHGPTKAKTLACLDQWKNEATKENVVITHDGEVTLVTNAGDALGFTFTSDTTLLLVIGVQATIDGVKQIRTGNSALSSSPAFVDIHSKVKAQDSVWMLANGSSGLFDEAAQLGMKPKAVFGSIHVTDTLAADIRARLDTADQATQAAAAMRGQVDAVAPMVGKLEISSDGADVRLVGSASSEKLEALVKTLDL